MWTKQNKGRGDAGSGGDVERRERREGYAGDGANEGREREMEG